MYLKRSKNNKNIGKAKTPVLSIRTGFNADTNPAFFLNADLDPGSQTNADPDSDPGKILKSKSDKVEFLHEKYN
jgi:hypothetical protein